MKTHQRAFLFLLVLSFSLVGQEYYQWKSIGELMALKEHTDSITNLPPGKGRLIAKSIQNNAIQKGDSSLYAHALLLEADINYHSGHLNASSASYNEALSVFQKLKAPWPTALALIKLAVLDGVQGNTYYAVHKLQKSLNRSGDTSTYLQALAHYNIAQIQAAHEEYALARQHLQQATTLCADSAHCPQSLVYALQVQWASIHLKYGDWKEAEKALNEVRQVPPKTEYAYNLALAKSALWMHLGSLDKAEKAAEKGWDYARKHSSPQMQAQARIQWARVMAKKNQYPQAIESARQALIALQQIDGAPILQQEALSLLSQYYLSDQDSTRALMTLITLNELKDSIATLQLNVAPLAPAEKHDTEPEKINQPDTLTSKTPRAPLIIIKGNREKIIVGIITILFVGLVIGIIPLIKLNQDRKGNKALRKELDDVKHNRDELTQQLNEVVAENQRLEELDKNKNKVFSVLSHDIRQPINQVKSVLDLLVEQSLSADDRKEIINKLRESLNSSNQALENLLLWSKKQMAGITTNMVDVHLLPQIWQLESHVKENLEAKRIKLNIDVPDFFKVYADMNQLDICLKNLVNNAIKFSNRGGVITIDTLQDGDSKIIRVIDNGVGMTEEQVENILNVKGDFSTLGTMNEKGTGLGLLIVRDFMETQQGHLEISSQKGQGSIFSLVFSGKRPARSESQ